MEEKRRKPLENSGMRLQSPFVARWSFVRQAFVKRSNLLLEAAFLILFVTATLHKNSIRNTPTWTAGTYSVYGLYHYGGPNLATS